MSVTWLPLSHRKGIETPRVILEEYSNQNYGGYYLVGTKDIVVVANPDWIDDIPTTIAHEYRHYTQYVQGTYSLIKKPSYIRTDLEYEEQIAWYFRTFDHEYDALLYQDKYARSETSHWWLKHLVKPN